MRHVVKIIAATGSGVAANSGGGGGGAATLIGSETDGLAIDFTDMSAVVRDTTTPANDFSGNPNDLLTYSAPSAKWIYNSSGVLVSGSTLRTNYDPSTLAARGILVEGQRTNLLLQSQDFTTTWTASNAAVTANQIAAKDGATTADLITISASGGEVYQSFNATAAAHAFSCFFKKGTNTFAVLSLSTAAPVAAECAWFNLDTGAVGTTGANLTSASIEDCGGGWYRCTIVDTLTAAAWRAGVSTSTADASQASAANDTIYVWQGQAEAGSFSTSPIVTTTAQVTRAADNVNLAITALPFSTTVGLMAVEAITAAGYDIEQVLVAFHGPTSGNQVQMYRNATNFAAPNIATGGSLEANIDPGGARPDNTNVKLAISWAANDFAGSRDGGAPVKDAVGLVPFDISTLKIGRNVDAEREWGGHIKTLLYLPRNRASDAELQAFSA